jgi:hypothetical protein
VYREQIGEAALSAQIRLAVVLGSLPKYRVTVGEYDSKIDKTPGF